MSTATSASGSAERWGPRWGARAYDWAENELQQAPTYEAAIRRVGIRSGQRVLEVGCGTGVFLRAAADRGAEVSGLDASADLLEIARTRVPEADLRVGDMQFLPYEDDRFDLVAGFNTFFFAADMVAALREAGRVARPGAPVVIQVWGRPEACDLTAMKRVAAPYMPAPPPDAPRPPALWRPGVLEQFATAAGLEPQDAFDHSWAYEYPDAETLGRCMAAVGGIGVAAGPREGELRAALVEALAPHRAPDGTYRLANEWRFLIARA